MVDRNNDRPSETPESAIDHALDVLSRSIIGGPKKADEARAELSALRTKAAAHHEAMQRLHNNRIGLGPQDQVNPDILELVKLVDEICESEIASGRFKP